MTQSVACPHCQRQLSLRDDLAGKRLACPHCKGEFLAPLPVAIIPLDRPEVIGDDKPEKQPEKQPEQESSLDFLSQPAKPSSARYYLPVKRKKSPVGLYVFGGLIGLAAVGGVIAFAVVQSNESVHQRKMKIADEAVKESEKLSVETEKVLAEAKQQLEDVKKAREAIKKDRENYANLVSSDNGWGSTMKEALDMFGEPTEHHHTTIGSTEFFDATWRNELRTITITAKYFSSEQRGMMNGKMRESTFCVVSKAWYNN